MSHRSKLAAEFWIGDNKGIKNIVSEGLNPLFHPFHQSGESDFLFGGSESAVADVPDDSLHKQVRFSLGGDPLSINLLHQEWHKEVSDGVKA
jgi:hypothetical protein